MSCPAAAPCPRCEPKNRCRTRFAPCLLQVIHLAHAIADSSPKQTRCCARLTTRPTTHQDCFFKTHVDPGMPAPTPPNSYHRPSATCVCLFRTCHPHRCPDIPGRQALHLSALTSRTRTPKWFGLPRQPEVLYFLPSQLGRLAADAYLATRGYSTTGTSPPRNLYP